MIDKVKADHGGRSPDVITRGHGVSITGGAMEAWKSAPQVYVARGQDRSRVHDYYGCGMFCD